MEYDPKSVDLAIEQARTFLVHTIETVAVTYEVKGSSCDTLESIQERFENCELEPDALKVYDEEGLSFVVDEVQLG